MKDLRNLLIGAAALAIAAAWLAMPAAAAAKDGKAIFEGEKCNLCHSVPSAGIEATSKSDKMKGPELLVPNDAFTAEWLTKYIKKEVEHEGKTHKRDFKGTDEELKTLVDWLLANKVPKT
ncbi:MAG: cytochrome c [Thermoanaerobaculia bacterium]|nr:cytochrome c [Thermoanaerobaculia bacterium]